MPSESIEKFIDDEVNKLFKQLERYFRLNRSYEQKRRAIWSKEAYLLGIGKALVMCMELGEDEADYPLLKLRELLKYDDFWHEYGILNESEQ